MTGGLFDAQEESERRASAPLAERMRPRTLEEFVGQEALLLEGAVLRRMLDSGELASIVLWGPPGTGKTTLARMLADRVQARFVPFSAVLSGVKELREICREAERQRARETRTLLFVDEIHRFSKSQQDAFLPFVEAGDVILVGATTENPSFALTPALQSRLLIQVLELLSDEHIVSLVRRALADSVNGLGATGVELEDDAFAALARFATGDARRAYTALEAVVRVAQGERVTQADVERVLGRPLPVHDKAGEEHFNLLSAFHKSLRNSDADAALYWMVRMLDGGEDPNVIVRRMCAFAAEDVGLADPRALQMAHAALESVRFLGMPEGRLAMGSACLYLALAPRSNAVYRALAAASEAVRSHPRAVVPLQLRNAPTRAMRELGYGSGYVYAHDTEAGVAAMQCLPDTLVGARFYRPSDRGFEAQLAARMAALAQARAGTT